MPKPILLQRSGRPPLRLPDAVAASAHYSSESSGRGTTRWYEWSLYALPDGQFALAVAYRTRWEGETDYYWATSGTPAHIADWAAEILLPPRYGYPRTEAHAQRQDALDATLRSQWDEGVRVVLADEVFAVAVAHDAAVAQRSGNATVHLLNSAMMPAYGTYRYRPLTEEEFASRVREASVAGRLRSYIGYQQTADMISRLSGVPVEVNRAETQIQPGDELLIARLRYRVQDPARKGRPVTEDFAFGMSEFEG